MVPFAGWEMPVSYPIGTIAEVKACRSACGLFDVSHMGEVSVAGPDASRFLDTATTNDLKRLQDGSAQYSLLLTGRGGVVDDIIVYRETHSRYLIVVNASRRAEDFARLREIGSSYAVEIADISDEKGLIAVQGPESLRIIAALIGAQNIPKKRFDFTHTEMAGCDVTVSRTGYTGEDGVELLCETADARAVWDTLLGLGAVPCGLGARDLLRLEAGYPLYGHELDEEHTPFESGVGWVVKMDKGDFAGRSALLEAGPAARKSKLVGLQTTAPANAIARPGCPVETADLAEHAGVITSGTLSPIVAAGIALARVRTDLARVGQELAIDIRGRKVMSRVVRLPFVGGAIS